jgi:hypothetical protein
VDGGLKGYTARFDRQIDVHTYIDEWGTAYTDNGAPWPVAAPFTYPVATKQDLLHYRPDDPTLAARLDGMRRAKELAQERVAVMGGINGPLTIARRLSGQEVLKGAINEDPSFAGDLSPLSIPPA